MVATIEFDVDTVFALHRKKSFELADFFSYVGGILGLFAGFSVISGFDVLYYFIAQPLMDFYKKRRDRVVHPVAGGRRKKVMKKIEKFSKKLQSFLDYFKNFLVSSSIHSFNQFGRDEKGWIDRLTWFILFIISMILTIFMTQDVYKTFKNTKIVMSMEGSPTNVENVRISISYFHLSHLMFQFLQIPFPAFTIIRDVEFNVKLYFRINKSLSFEESDDLYYQLYTVVCNGNPADRGAFEDRPLFEFKKSTDLVYFLKDYTFYQRNWFEEMEASWNKDINPPFAQILTASLYGYTFNLVEQSKLLDEKM